MPASSDCSPIESALKNREVTDELRRFIRAKLSRYERNHFRIEDETEEAFQSVSLRALERSSQFNPTRGCEVAWLKGVAKRVIFNKYRGEQKFGMVLEELVEEARQVQRARGTRRIRDISVEAFVEEAIQVQRCSVGLIDPSSPKIRDVITSLSQKSQEVFKFSYEERMKGEELARALSCPTTGAARVIGFRLREEFTAAWARVAFRVRDVYEIA